ncbi:MAG: hypothetical protein SFY67_06560 [Candidatus Melainabacteria bacterium]|nr:hypothetical protein [Candidatus Melainabacteria bacterium]
MQITHYVYGVYDNQAAFSKAYDRLFSSGLSDIMVLKSPKADIEHVSASIRHPLNRFMLSGAALGAIIGSYASVTFNMPAFVGLEVLTPVMIAICGAALGAYIGLLVNFALTGLDVTNPQTKVFDALIPAGSFVLGASVCGNDQMQLAIECISEDQMIELVIKNEMLDLPLEDARLIKEERQLQLAA